MYNRWNYKTFKLGENMKSGDNLIIQIDFNSDEAIYLQLRNQIIMQIATARLAAGDSLPSVRQLAELVGINMHTVNKAYAVLKQEGYITLDRRRGAVIAVDLDHAQAEYETMRMLEPVLAQGYCRGMHREEIHEMIDRIYDAFDKCTMCKNKE